MQYNVEVQCKCWLLVHGTRIFIKKRLKNFNLQSILIIVDILHKNAHKNYGENKKVITYSPRFVMHWEWVYIRTPFLSGLTFPALVDCRAFTWNITDRYNASLY